MVEWLSSWHAEEKVRGSILDLATCISEIGYLQSPSCDMAEIRFCTTKAMEVFNTTNQKTRQWKIE